MYKLKCLILLYLIDFIIFVQCQDFSLSNLNGKCLRCLCEAATGCDLERTCDVLPGYCGPYQISKIYWIEAGNVTLPTDDPIRVGSYEDCSNEYYCAGRITKSYLKKFGQDCDGNGVTDCYDFMMINFNGGYGCKKPMEKSTGGRNWLKRYKKCMGQEVVVE